MDMGLGEFLIVAGAILILVVAAWLLTKEWVWGRK